MADQKEVMRLNELAYEMRKKLLNLCGHYQGAVHIGGDLSMTDLLIGLYHHGLNVNPEDIHMPTRDRFVLSKGHAAVCMYIAMAMRGFFDYDEIVSTYGQMDSAYGMHPCKVHLPGVECSSGSLGHGFPMAVGMAISARTKGEKHRVYCMVGDGESAEGSIWEAATVAHSQDLGNLIVIVDRNRQFMTSFSEDLVKLEPYTDKWKAFGFRVVEIDGHNMAEIVDALDNLLPFSVAVTGLGFFTIATATTLPMVFIGSFLHGIAIGWYTPNNSILYGEIMPPEAMTFTMGVTGAIGNLGQLVSTVAFAWIADALHVTTERGILLLSSYGYVLLVAVCAVYIALRIINKRKFRRNLA